MNPRYGNYHECLFHHLNDRYGNYLTPLIEFWLHEVQFPILEKLDIFTDGELLIVTMLFLGCVTLSYDLELLVEDLEVLVC